MKHYRFFMHYNKKNNKMTVHFRGKCYIAKDVICEPEVQTKWNDKQQPHLVLQGYCRDISVGKGDLDMIVIQR